MNKKVKISIEFGLFFMILFLAYFVFNSIYSNIHFENEKERKTELIITRLSDARELQLAYESKYGTYTNTWQELIRFAKHDSLEFEKHIGNTRDSIALRTGKASILKIKIPVLQKLIQDKRLSNHFSIDSVKFVPESKYFFDIQSNSIYKNNNLIPTFQIGITWDKILQGYNKQLIINSMEDSQLRTGYPGIRVGNINEASTEGNWQ